MFVSAQKTSFVIPFLISFSGHILGVFVAVYAFNKEPNTNLAKVSYTVSLEKGKSKSSTNVSKVKKKAPVKKASLKKEKKEVKKVKKVKKAPKKIIPKKVENKEIVSLKKKEEKKKVLEKKKVVPKKVVKKVKKEKKVNVNKEYQDAMKEYLSIAKTSESSSLSTEKSRINGSGGSGILKSPEFFKYFSLLERHIRGVWNWHDSRVSYVATLSFKINPDGSVHSIRVMEGSGNRLYDQSVVRAVKKASPVPIPPRKVYADFRHVIMDFTPE